MLDAFRPNTKLSIEAYSILIAVEVAVLLIAWCMAGTLSIPGPLDTFSALGTLITQGGLLYDLKVSLTVNVEAILISSILSVGLAYLTVMPVFRPFVEFCSKARFFSMAGFVPMFIFAFGGGHALKVALLTFGMSVFFITSMAAVVANIPKADFNYAKSLRMGPWRSVLEMVIFGKMSDAFEIFRQNAAIGWMMLTMVEGLVRSEGGIGGIILNTTKYRRFDYV
ncbi:MAG TPA: hypothetical protein VIE65_13755, partial [Methylobacter sp.]